METGESRQIVVGSLPTRALLCFFVCLLVFFFFFSLIQRRGGVSRRGYKLPDRTDSPTAEDVAV